MDQRANFLALILLDALEDQNESNVYSILEKNNVDASHVLKEKGISSLHYACGMENQKLSYDFCKAFLERGANPNVLSDENMTPLHVAAMYGRAEIVKLLMQHGAKLDVYDDQRKMPLHYAIEECHFDVVQLMRDQIFLKKYENKKTSTPNRGCINKHLQVANENGGNGAGLLTPNRIHYNYDVTSPYYINITHRRHKPQPVFPASGPLENQVNEVETQTVQSEEKQNSEDIQSVNLFALTKESLQEMSRHLTPAERTRISIIETWREKVRQSRANQAILKEYSNVEEMIDNVMENEHLNFTNTLLKEKSLKEAGEGGNSDADSGACSSEPNDNVPQPTPARGGFSLGQLIQKIAKAQLINNDEPQQKQPTPPKANPNDTISSYQTVPEYTATKSKIGSGQSKDTLKVPERDVSFIRSPKSIDYFLQMTEAYVHTDDENGLVFYETKLLSNQNGKTAQLPTDGNGTPRINADHDTTATTHSTNVTLPVDYETDALRAELTNFGIPPGPITKSTKRLYIKRLIKYKRKTASMLELQKQQQEITKFSVELQRTLQSLEDFARVAEYLKFEKQSAQYFAQHKDKREMREGHLKQSFIYMLIDPRTSCNLPGESVFLDKLDIWQRFLNSIFYVGKGKTSRPYSHLYAAMKTHSRQHEKATANAELKKNGEKKSIRKTPLNMDIFKSPPLKPTESRKLDRILDIWGNGNGVVCLHVFHNIVPSEAYTREAAIIDALGLKHLTNMKRGDYYGPAKTWPMKEKKYLGIALLYKAMQIYLAEGESQLSPSDLI